MKEEEGERRREGGGRRRGGGGLILSLARIRKEGDVVYLHTECSCLSKYQCKWPLHSNWSEGIEMFYCSPGVSAAEAMDCFTTESCTASAKFEMSCPVQVPPCDDERQ